MEKIDAEIYKSHKIYFDKNADTFCAEDEQNVVIAKHASLRLLKEAVDRHIKSRMKFKPIQIILRGKNAWGYENGKEFVKATLTSINGDGEAYVSLSPTDRHKRYRRDPLYLDTPENNAQVKVIEQKEAEIKKLEAEIEGILRAMPKVDKTKFGIKED